MTNAWQLIPGKSTTSPGRALAPDPEGQWDSPMALRRVIAHCERQKARDAAYWDQMIDGFKRRLAELPPES